jgi:hypothetical protein
VLLIWWERIDNPPAVTRIRTVNRFIQQMARLAAGIPVDGEKATKFRHRKCIIRRRNSERFGELINTVRECNADCEFDVGSGLPLASLDNLSVNRRFVTSELTTIGFALQVGIE